MMPSLTEQEMRYSPGSLLVIELITERLEEMLGELSSGRAMDDGRSLVTAQDVVASFEDQVIGKLVREIRGARGEHPPSSVKVTTDLETLRGSRDAG